MSNREGNICITEFSKFQRAIPRSLYDTYNSASMEKAFKQNILLCYKSPLKRATFQESNKAIASSITLTIFCTEVSFFEFIFFP
jgi:hypothetical protein